MNASHMVRRSDLDRRSEPPPESQTELAVWILDYHLTYRMPRKRRLTDPERFWVRTAAAPRLCAPDAYGGDPKKPLTSGRKYAAAKRPESGGVSKQRRRALLCGASVSPVARMDSPRLIAAWLSDASNARRSPSELRDELNSVHLPIGWPIKQ